VHRKLLPFLNAGVRFGRHKAMLGVLALPAPKGERWLLAPKGERWFREPAVMFLSGKSVFLERAGSPGSFVLAEWLRNEMSTSVQVFSCPSAPTKQGLHRQSRIVCPMPEKSPTGHRDLGSRAVDFSISHLLRVADLTGITHSKVKTSCQILKKC